MTENLIELVNRLRDFKKSLDFDNVEEFENLISTIIEKLPENYGSKIKALTFYEIYEDPDPDDLPF